MRTLLRILALVPLVLPLVGPATSDAATIGGTPSDVVSSMAGHWRCTASTGGVTHRSYVVTDGGPAASGVSGSATTRAAGGIRSSMNTPGAAGAAQSIARTVYGRQDGADGSSFERIVEHTDRTLSAQAPEGVAEAAASDASSLRFNGLSPAVQPVSEEAASGGTGRWAASTARAVSAARPLSLSYSVDSGSLRRVARLGSETLSSESCTREVQTASGSCANPNAPVAAAHAVQPMSQTQGAVQMRLVIDDRGRVVGEDVIASSSPALTQSAIAAARESTFTAAMASCRAVSSQHTFGVDFTRRASNNARETNL